MSNKNQEIKCIDNVVYGKKVNFTLKNTSFGDFLFNQAEKYANNIFHISADTGETETYYNFKQRTTRVALEMRKKGITSEDVILTCTYNTMDSTLPIYAAQYLGAKVASLDPTQSIRDYAYLIELVQPKMIFFCREATSLMEESLKNSNCKPELVLFESNNNKYTKFKDFLTQNDEEEALFKPTKINDFNKTAFIYFSSGTTGFPKGITISHFAILYATECLLNTNAVFDCIMHLTTFYWISAIFVSTAAIMCGGRRVVCRSCPPENLFKIFQDLKVTFAFIASNYAYKLTKKNTNYDTTYLNTLMFGGGGINSKQLHTIQMWHPHSAIYLAYGLTEIAGCATMFDPKTDKELYQKYSIVSSSLSSGKPHPGLAIKIVDLETNQNLSYNQKGEIRIQTPSCTLEYYNQTSDDICDENGFLKTGDIGYYDENYCFYIVDRIKEMFKYQSWHIVPSVIESVIIEHPSVRECVVVGLPHETDGELPLAIIVLNENCDNVKAEEIIKFVDERVDDRQKIRGGVKFVKEIPRTPSGKVMRRLAREMILKK